MFGRKWQGRGVLTGTKCVEATVVVLGWVDFCGVCGRVLRAPAAPRPFRLLPAALRRGTLVEHTPTHPCNTQRKGNHLTRANHARVPAQPALSNPVALCKRRGCLVGSFQANATCAHGVALC